MYISPYDAKIKTKTKVKVNLPSAFVIQTASILTKYLDEVGKMLPSGSFDEDTMNVIKYWTKLAEMVE